MFDSTEASVARLRLPRLDTSVVNTPVQEQLHREEPVPELLVEDRLLSAVSNVLDISRHSIDLIDSFTDLGGNETSAQELRKRCMSVGLGLKTNDILRCQTLAELQTCATPFAPAEPLESNEGDLASDASEVSSDVMRKSSDEKLHSHQQIPPQEMDDRHALERLIMSTPEVSGAAVVRPKAGFLEGKLITFVSLNNSRLSQYSLSTIHVISQSQMHFAGSQIAAIRLALEQTASDITLPSNWIVLDQMPVTADGIVDRRKLQTWVQNMNESMYKQVTSLESDKLFQEPLTDMERTVQKAVARVLRIPEREIGMNFSFPQLGGDEVSTMLLVAACRTQGVSLRPEDIMQSATLSQMASLASYKAAVGNHWSEESLEGFKLSPMQQLYFDTATGGRNEMRTRTDGSYRFNQSLLLRVTSNVTLEDIHAAVETVVAHHSMLRCRFRCEDDAWTQRIIPDVQGSYGFGYHHVNDYGDVFMIIEKAQTQINIENGPVFAVEHFRTPDGQQLIYLVAHHLVIDQISWRILIHDLDELLREGTLFSERSMPFQTWNELQEDEITRTGEASPLPFDPVSCDFAYWGLEESLNTYGEAHEISFSISAELTSILHTTCNQVFRTDSADIYMTALHLSFCQTFPDRPSPTIWNKEHGREPWNTDVDITETVGWLASLCPIGLRSTNSEDFLHVLRDLKDTRRSLARRGWDYFASRYFGAYAPTRCAEGWPFEIMFSYNGSLRQLERENGALEQVPIPGPSVGTSVSNFGHEVSRMALFEVSMSTDDSGCAKVDFVYNRLSSHQERIGDWIQTFEHLLYEAVGRLRYRAQELTLADVPLLNTDYAGLTKLNTDRLVALGLSSARDIEDVYPVTAAQQQILISQTLSLETCHSTNLYELTLLNGTQADQSHICSVWQQIVAKFPALRTVFIDSISLDGLFDQVVLRQCSPNMLFFDAAPGDDPISALKNLPDFPTNPAQPRHRLSVCNSNQGTYIKLEASQALCDMFSMQLLVADLRRIYNSGKTPMKVQDPSRSACVQYLETARRDDSLLFWQNRLKEMPPDNDAPNGLQQSIGCFANTIPCAMDLWAYQSIEAIVRDAEEDFASCLAHEHIGASEIEHALGLKGETLFNSCFTYTEEPPVLKSRFSSTRPQMALKAGGCIVPVDGEDSGMVEAVIKQVNPQVILVTVLIGSKLHLFNDSVIVVNEALFSTHLQADSPTRKASGDDVACILFPAGSSRTKELRGFAYSHTALSSAFLAQGSALDIDQESRVLQLSSFSIDTALVETLATLIHGGCICIPSPTERKRDVDGAIRRMAVTWTYLTPILARRLNPVKLPSLKVTCFRTRGLDEDTCGPWMEHTKLLLVYGCLEICPLGISAFKASKREDLQRVAKPFLGKFWIANPEDASKLVPNGAIGELCIESPIIAQKFVHGQPLKPLTQKLEQAEDGRQMVRYVKTSQRVRYMEDGSIELLPSSHQDMAVDGKVVESAKIEQELRRCLGQGVDVAVEAVVCKDGTQLLAAFVQLEKSWDGSEELTHLNAVTRERVFSAKKVADPSLRDICPTHMVPRVYIPVKRLPVTTAMKINRRKLQKMVKDLTEEQLAAISGTSPAHLDSSVRMKPLPLTQVEEHMRSIWADLLDVSEDAIDGNQTFVKLGGGTYLAAKLVVTCNRAGMSIHITDVLRGASLTELCQSVTLSSEAMLNVDLLPSRRSLDTSSGTLLDETFIEEVIVPQLGVSRKAIKDVCEAFPAQVRSLELGMMKDRGDVTYITLNITRLQSVKKLESACFGLCMIHPILRSVFIAHERKVYQVAVRSSGPDFKKLQCPSWRLSGLTAKLIKKDQEEPLTLGKPITRFIHVDSGHQSTLIMRLSKAQCDEASIPILIHDLKRLYTATEKPPRRPTHFEFIRLAQTSNRESAMKHWASLLENAEMTQVVPRDAPAPLSTSVRTIREKVSITSLSGLGITLDTVVKAAWAIVLANLSASGDVLFGEIVDGRQLRLADGSSVSGVVGPTGNTLPVRVRFGDAYCTPMDILQTIHGQRALAKSFGNMDWRAVVDNSPKIPLWTPFSTVVYHQPTEDKKQPTDFKLGNASCKLVVQESPFRDLHDLLVTSSLPSPTRAEIALTFCENRIPRTFADETLEYLVSTIELLTSVSMMHPLIPSATDFATMRPQLPLPQPDFDAIQTQSSAGLPTDLSFAIQSVVATAWTKILDPRSLGVPEKQLHNAAFYDLWGSLIPASQLAEYLTRELPRIGIVGLDDIRISMEEIIANPTMMAQFELVARKIRDSRDGVKKRLAATHRSPAAIGKSLRRLTSNVIKEKGHGRSASDSSTESLALKITHPHLNPPSQLGARPQPIPEATSAAAADPVAEMDGDEIELDEEQLFEHYKNRPAPQPLSLIMERDDSGSSMESLTTGTSESDEEEDVAMPMSRGPRSLGGTASTVSPVTPGVKQGHLFGRSNSGLTEAKGSSGPGLMKKKASSMFGRLGLMGPVGVNH
ncbi:hypothetical protein ACHAPH_006824 [Verticillium nonalfalfae]